MHQRSAAAAGALGAAWVAAVRLGRRPRDQGAAVRLEEAGSFDVAVIGGGLVGLAVAREAAARGKSVVLLEKEPAFAASASGGNTGLGHTGYDAPEGSLERKLLRRAISLHPGLYRSFGLDSRHARHCGSLVVAWSQEQLQQLPAVLAENAAAGDRDAYRVGPEELHELEPALSHDALGAVVCPNEAVVEPWLVAVGYAEAAARHGADLRLATQVTSASRRGDGAGSLWHLGTSGATADPPARSRPGEVLVRPPPPAAAAAPPSPSPPSGSVSARTVVNCGGVLGDHVEALRLGDASLPFHVTPRKGQFVVFATNVELQHVIETVPTQFTKGVIVWSTVYGNVVVGPTATDQQSRTDRSTDQETVQTLRDWASRVVPELRDAEVVGTYSGLRPATEFRDYCIQAHPKERWITVGGIRSTGLTACCAIGEYVVDLMEEFDGIQPRDRPMLGVFDAKHKLRPPRVRVANGEVPSLAQLAAEYRANGDGTVTVYGRRWTVTHPLSSFGMETYTGEQAGVTS